MFVSLRCARWIVAPLLMVGLSACASPDEGDTSGLDGSADRPLMIAQNARPNAVMDALFQGRVVVDSAGCLRLDPGERVTVIWPRGFTLDRRNSGFFVRDASGREVGRIGSEFRLGGGHVPSLHDGIPLNAADRQRAMSRCPGIFWIVGDIP